MNTPKRAELIESLKNLKDRGLVDDVAYSKYLYNFDYYEQNLDLINSNYKDGWVASINGKFYFHENFKNLVKNIDNVDDSNRAYIFEV